MTTFEEWAKENWMYISDPTDALVIWKAAQAAQAASIADTTGAKPIYQIESERIANLWTDVTCAQYANWAYSAKRIVYAAPPANPVADTVGAKYREALEQIVSVKNMYCDHHINVPKIVYQLAEIAEEELAAPPAPSVADAGEPK